MSYKRRTWYKNLREIHKTPVRQNIVQVAEEYKETDRKKRNFVAKFFIFIGEFFADWHSQKANDLIEDMGEYIDDLELELAYLRSAVDAQEHNTHQHESMRKRYSELRHQAYLKTPRIRLVPQPDRPN